MQQKQSSIMGFQLHLNVCTKYGGGMLFNYTKIKGKFGVPKIELSTTTANRH